MSPATRNAVGVLGAGLAVGVIADLLLPVEPWGLNFFLCVAALVAAGVWVVRRAGIAPSPDAGWLALTALLLGAAFLRRDTEFLQVLDVGALLGVFALAAPAAAGVSVRGLRVGAYIAAFFASARNAFIGTPLAWSDMQWRELPIQGKLGPVRGVALGALIALPLLFLFGALFAGADPVFSRAMSGIFEIDLEQVGGHVLRTGFLGAFAAGYLRGVVLERPAVSTPVPASGAPADRSVPVLTALVLIDALFLLFVVIQLRYFFGGSARVQEIAGLTYAEYARKGFFELMWASALVVPLLLAAEWAVRGAAPASLRRFRLASGGMLALLAVVVASALERMRLYVAAYGLTEDRLYATAVMIGIVIVLAWLGWTVLRGHGERFAFGAVIQALTVLAGLHVLNPDAFIARHNLSRPTTDRSVDVAYVASLSADAAPVLFDVLPRLSPAEACEAVKGLVRWGQDNRDWRTWNWSRARAQRLARHPSVTAVVSQCPKGEGS